jgi:hypothetical protein
MRTIGQNGSRARGGGRARGREPERLFVSKSKKPITTTYTPTQTFTNAITEKALEDLLVKRYAGIKTLQDLQICLK